MATNRIRACQGNPDDSPASVRDFFDEDVTEEHIIRNFAALRVPRHLFRFLYRLLTEHCNSATEDTPNWNISAAEFDRVLDVYQREVATMDTH